MRKGSAAAVLLAFSLMIGCRSKPAASPSSTQSQIIAVDLVNGGSISGVVLFDGEPPKPQPIDMSQDPGCLSGPASARVGEAYAIRDGKFGNVLIYVKGVKAGQIGPLQTVDIDQKGCRYIPHVVAVEEGAPVRFLNSDPAEHNIHAPQFNVSQMPGAPPVTKIFTDPAIMLPIECNQHPWMEMELNVMPSPFFAVSKPDGSFVIHGLPPGEYTLAAVHERLGEKTVRVNVSAKTVSNVTFTYSQGDVAAREAR